MSHNLYYMLNRLIASDVLAKNKKALAALHAKGASAAGELVS
jgi:hypothetical protein